MKIAIIVEGKTEKAFIQRLREYLKTKLAGKMPKLKPLPYDGRIPTCDKLKRVVEGLLSGKDAVDAVIALTDVYTGSNPPEFEDAADAKAKMRKWVGKEQRFYPHVAQHDFEAWLLPYWDKLVNLAKCDGKPPTKGDPEKVNHGKPPAHIISELFERGKCRDSYVKPRDAGRILRDSDLAISIKQCSELRNLVERIILLCGGDLQSID
ncbi:MAG: DUF4276 family protein [Planctomycetota bacterium]|jgi:hypothetical protein|nr:DUF4276 family protein [Planctomycetota bacterium]